MYTTSEKKKTNQWVSGRSIGKPQGDELAKTGAASDVVSTSWKEGIPSARYVVSQRDVGDKTTTPFGKGEKRKADSEKMSVLDSVKKLAGSVFLRKGAENDIEDNEALNEIVGKLFQEVKALEVSNYQVDNRNDKNGVFGKSEADFGAVREKIAISYSKRKELMEKQAALRQEILDINNRLSSLETLYKSIANDEKTTSKRKQLSTKAILSKLVELGLREKVTPEQKKTIIKKEVGVTFTNLLEKQASSINEISKYDMIRLKRPNYILLMDRILK